MKNINDVNAKACVGCGGCAKVCTSGAISMQKGPDGFLIPVTDNEKCICCGKCVDVCPIDKDCNMHNKTDSYFEKKYRIVRTADENILKNSSSGGAFSLIADVIIKEGGMVCGAAFDGQFRVKHILSDDISPMRKSKYVQSELDGCFSEIAEVLKSGKRVLFTGTPCQCHSMKLYMHSLLENDAENRLVTVALVCRGVLSPKLWEEYVSYLNADGELEAYDFRNKNRKNYGHTVRYVQAGEEKTAIMQEDSFCRIYLKGLGYRESCYNCVYCTPESDFDFITGDCFEVEKLCPAFADGMGASLVITGSDKAEEIVEKFSNNAKIFDTDKNAAMVPALTQPAKKSMLNRFLIADLNKTGEDGHPDIATILKKYGA